jgi:tetratricopeptide (TPR) repeat protein
MYLSNRIGVFAFLLVLILASTESVYARKKRVEPNRDKTTYLLLEAQRLEQMQNPDSLVVAFEILKKASEEDPQNQEARFKLASYYRALYMPEKYYNVVMEAAQLDTTNYYYSLEAAENAIKVRDYKQALEIYQRLIRNNPNDEKLYLEMSDAYISMGDIENAMACYDKIENLTENVEYVALSKAGIYEHFRMYDKAIVELKRISDAYPQGYTVTHGFFSNFSASLACISNIGPGFEAVGPYASYAGYSEFSKVLLSFVMLIGRLEILPVFMLFTPRTWKRS